MKQYGYDYEQDNYYCYPDSNVLKNKLNIQDVDALKTAEEEITALRASQLSFEPCLLNI